jgi:hypothetical protein
MDSVQYAETFVKSKQNTAKGSFEESSVFYEQYIRFQFLLTYYFGEYLRKSFLNVLNMFTHQVVDYPQTIANALYLANERRARFGHARALLSKTCQPQWMSKVSAGVFNHSTRHRL